ncbi:MAG: hypothetical protein MRQ05_01850 [Candidatus Midichloria mitochondrii]|nr:hypothetical protein [Candidatus Midichloria mitochondrii]MDJ1312863.1 hypothetical protein [Candidatus Midichloria mitochondrii]
MNTTDAQALINMSTNIPLIKNLVEQKNVSAKLTAGSANLMKEAGVNLIDYATLL